MRLITCILSLGLVLTLVSCGAKKLKKEQPEIYPVLSPRIGDAVNIKEYVADINSVQNVEIRSRIRGFIQDIFVDEGKVVREGEILFSVDSKEYQQELSKSQAVTKSALAELKSAEIELENTKKLFEQNIVSEAEHGLALARVEAMRAKVDEARSSEEKAQLNLSFTEIRAPFNGIINRIPNKTGSLVEEGSLLTTISDNEYVFAYFYLSEKDYLNYVSSSDKSAYRREVSLILADEKRYTYPGLIETTESEFDTSTGNIAFRAKFPNPDRLLKHGATGKVVLKQLLKDVLLIPQKSTMEIQADVYVYVVDAKNIAHLRKIGIGYRLPQSRIYTVRFGLTSDEKIVYEGGQQIKSGELIRTIVVPFEP